MTLECSHNFEDDLKNIFNWIKLGFWDIESMMFLMLCGGQSSTSGRTSTEVKNTPNVEETLTCNYFMIVIMRDKKMQTQFHAWLLDTRKRKEPTWRKILVEKKTR